MFILHLRLSYLRSVTIRDSQGLQFDLELQLLYVWSFPRSPLVAVSFPRVLGSPLISQKHVSRLIDYFKIAPSFLYDVLNPCPIAGVFLTHAQCFRDRLQNHCDPAQDDHEFSHYDFERKVSIY